MHIVGTAGHVDHGKSALVRALTGTDPDRWLEEQRRGMTLDLGFAHLRFADGTEAGIIDVPGHERFLHNMLAGAAGMEVVLLVVAVNEGVKPQTLEHLAILRYLNVRRTLVVVSKSDIATADELAGAQVRLRAALAPTIAHDATFYPVSTLSGAGLDALRDGLHATLRALPERAPNAPAYLPIDRVFALSGHGTIVTGTLMQGHIAIGDSLRLSPAARNVRVRAMQVFGSKRDRVGGGTRVAINVPGVERGEIARGAVLASAQFVTTTRLAVKFRPLPETLAMLKRRTPVRAYIGAAEILATLVFDTVPSGTEAVEAQLFLRRPTVAIPDAPFVVRRVSPMDVLGGGTIASASAGADETAENDHAPETAADAADIRETAAVYTVLRSMGLTGASAAAIGALANISEERVKLRLAELIADARAITVGKPHAYVAGDVGAEIVTRTLERLEARQRERPWLMGMTSIALAQSLALPEPGLLRVLAAYVETGSLVHRGGYYRTPDFTPRLNADQRAFFDRAFAQKPGELPAPVPIDRLAALIRASTVPELSAALDTLLAGGGLSKVGEFVYHGPHLRAIRTQLEEALRTGGQITVAQFRDVTGTSRKYAVPLLEFFDATGVTVRSGDVRTLRQTAIDR